MAQRKGTDRDRQLTEPELLAYLLVITPSPTWRGRFNLDVGSTPQMDAEHWAEHEVRCQYCGIKTKRAVAVFADKSLHGVCLRCRLLMMTDADRKVELERCGFTWERIEQRWTELVEAVPDDYVTLQQRLNEVQAPEPAQQGD